MIYIFRQYDSNKQIIIYAESYIEAKKHYLNLIHGLIRLITYSNIKCLILIQINSGKY